MEVDWLSFLGDFFGGFQLLIFTRVYSCWDLHGSTIVIQQVLNVYWLLYVYC